MCSVLNAFDWMKVLRIVALEPARSPDFTSLNCFCKCILGAMCKLWQFQLKKYVLQRTLLLSLFNELCTTFYTLHTLFELEYLKINLHVHIEKCQQECTFQYIWNSIVLKKKVNITSFKKSMYNSTFKLSKIALLFINLLISVCFPYMTNIINDL